MTDKIVVLSTCESAAEAREIARRLVERRLAACVSIVPSVTSVYHWKNAAGDNGIEESAEVLLIIKTARPLFRELSEELARHHTYELPEIIAVPLVDGSEAYLAWLDRELAHAPTEEQT